MAFVSIGNVKIEKTAALAPMAGVTNSTFRLICKEFGAALVVSEMISAKAVCFKDKKTKIFFFNFFINLALYFYFLKKNI